LIETIRSDFSPWEVFQSAAGAAGQAFFLDSIEHHPPDQSYSYLGFDPYLELTLARGRVQVRGAKTLNRPARDLFSVLRKLLREGGHAPAKNFFCGGAVGFFGYELAAEFERFRFRPKPPPGTPDIYLGFYRDLIVYDHRLKRYHLIARQTPGRSAAEIRAALADLKQKVRFLRPPVTGDFHLRGFRPEIRRPQFEAMVRRAKNYIAAGDIYQANLSQRFSFECGGPLLKLYGILRQINPSPFASFLKRGDLAVISSSPERLIRKRGRHCETRPIAGTRPRRETGKSGRQTERDLRANEKERAEHLMLVDLERNDLGRVCDFRSVKLEEFMKIERYSHVIHLVSKISGRLSRGRDALDLLRAVFPGGTITGCPKIRCMEIIDELEPVRRGLYTGSLGYLDFNGDMDLNIVIRTLVVQQNRGHLQVGAGIVHDSNPRREYEETLHKGEALMHALAEAAK